MNSPARLNEVKASVTYPIPPYLASCGEGWYAKKITQASEISRGDRSLKPPKESASMKPHIAVIQHNISSLVFLPRYPSAMYDRRHCIAKKSMRTGKCGAC
ncbi:hypothetical protein TWF481_008138 [Arthrobotrys musiformis]|uniref:Uncharacterized protein n=1 Tax=Arthrobotrys musiformis TaxID=47236 RepID=A0AAV9W688_9PEZI